MRSGPEGWNAFWTTRWRSSDARPPASASHWTWTASNPAMPRVSTPSPNGLRSDALLPGLRRLLRDRRCVGLEISEFNPSEDKDGRTLDFMLAVVANLVRDRAAGAS